MARREKRDEDQGGCINCAVSQSSRPRPRPTRMRNGRSVRLLARCRFAGTTLGSSRVASNPRGQTLPSPIGRRPTGSCYWQSRASGLLGELDEAILAQDAYYTTAMMKAMNGNCSNIQVLLSKYMSFCQQLDQDGGRRLKEWIACLRAGQQTCSGPGLP